VHADNPEVVAAHAKLIPMGPATTPQSRPPGATTPHRTAVAKIN